MKDWFLMLLLTTMSSLKLFCQQKRRTCFPGDPRYAAMTLTATAAEFSYLLQKEFLSTAVLDSIMQSTALPQDDASDETIPPPAMIGSLGCEAWILSSKFTASLTCKQVATQSE